MRWDPEAVSSTAWTVPLKSAAILAQVRQGCAGLRMQTLARQAIAELAKGFSTGLVLWAGSTPCTPTLVCGSCAVCPDCHFSCHDGVRIVRGAETGCGGFPWVWLFAALVCGVAVGFVAGRGTWTVGEIGESPRRGSVTVGKGGKGVVRQLE